jgi:hypothetical protein
MEVDPVHLDAPVEMRPPNAEAGAGAAQDRTSGFWQVETSGLMRIPYSTLFSQAGSPQKIFELRVGVENDMCCSTRESRRIPSSR